MDTQSLILGPSAGVNWQHSIDVLRRKPRKPVLGSDLPSETLSEVERIASEAQCPNVIKRNALCLKLICQVKRLTARDERATVDAVKIGQELLASTSIPNSVELYGLGAPEALGALVSRYNTSKRSFQAAFGSKTYCNRESLNDLLVFLAAGKSTVFLPGEEPVIKWWPKNEIQYFCPYCEHEISDGYVAVKH